MGASASLLMATIVLDPFIPAKCWIAPEIPTAMYNYKIWEGGTKHNTYSRGNNFTGLTNLHIVGSPSCIHNSSAGTNGSINRISELLNQSQVFLGLQKLVSSRSVTYFNSSSSADNSGGWCQFGSIRGLKLSANEFGLCAGGSSRDLRGGDWSGVALSFSGRKASSSRKWEQILDAGYLMVITLTASLDFKVRRALPA